MAGENRQLNNWKGILRQSRISKGWLAKPLKEALAQLLRHPRKP
jgi:hypothetical protein